jgi:ABC-type amino acid transport substrate-binding protein
MINMTKRLLWLRLFSLSLLTVLLISCGEDGLGVARTETPALSLSTPTFIPLPPDASIAARIRARGYLLVGARYDDDPFGIVDGQGDLIGFDVELAREFAARWLGDAEAVRFVQVTDASVSERVEMGQVDLVIGALSPNQSTARVMDFSAGYYYDGLSLVVRSTPSISDTITINGPPDLDGVAVGVVEDSDAEAPLLRAAGGAVPQVVFYPDYFSAVAGLESGVLGAVVGPRRTLERLTANSGSLGLTPRFTREPYVIGMPKNDGYFLDLVNVTLMNIVNDGTFSRLLGKWLPDKAPPELEIWAGTSRLSFDGLGDTLPPLPATIQGIEGRGYLMVGLADDQLPFDDFDANGVARGFEAELARVLAGRWLGDVAAVQFVRHTEESGVSALQTGQIDLLAVHLPHTLPRDDEIDFSQTIYQGGIGLLVSAASGINSLAGLNGGAVAVPGGGITAQVVQQAAAQTGIVVSVQTVDDVNGALTGVAEGRYSAYAGWRGGLLNLAYTNSGFLVLDERLSRRPIALGLRQNDAAFRDLVDFTLQELAAEGRFAALYDDWFGTDPPYPVEIWPGAPYRPLRLNRSPLVVPTAAP